MEVYTSKVYEIFSDEIDKSKSYKVFADQTSEEFIVRHACPDIVERYRRSEFKVQSINGGEKYICDCGMYEHSGLLCCHILRVSGEMFDYLLQKPKIYDLDLGKSRLDCAL